jgi:hypothetical protein
MPYIDGDIGPIHLDDTNCDVTKRMEYFYQNSITQAQSWWAEGDIDTRFYAGSDSNLYNEIYGSQPINRRTTFNFNRIRRVVSLIEGYQRRNRKQTVCTPIESSDEETANQFSKLLIYLNTSNGQLETLSTAFHGALITGMNLLQVHMDYTQDPINGDIRLSNSNFNEFIIDPFFKKQDLSDCNGIWKRNYLTKRALQALLPDRKEELDSLTFNTFHGKDGKFIFMPENLSYQNNLYVYDEFYYKDFRKQKLLVDTQTGEAMEWRSKNNEGLNDFLQMFPSTTVIDQEVPTVRMAITVNGRLFYDGPNGISDAYPFVPVLGYFTPELPYYSLRVQGVVRGIRDAQYLYSRRRTIELGILESQLTSGYKFKENALVDPKDIFQAGQGGGIALKESAQMTDVEQIIPPQIPPSMFQLSEAMADEINQISGINEELLGSATDDKAGILAQLRQGAGLTGLQGLFDQLDFAQKLVGKLNIEAIQNNWTPGKVKRILNEEPTPAFKNKNFPKYDCCVEESILTSTQRQMAFTQMLALREAGVAIPDSVLIENLNIQNKKQLRDSLDQMNQQQQQQQQMQAQSDLQLQQTQSMLAQARVDEQEALARERSTRSMLNLASIDERQQEAAKDYEQAQLNKIKQLSELESMDLEKISKLLEMAKMLEEPTPEMVASKASMKPKKPKAKRVV